MGETGREMGGGDRRVYGAAAFIAWLRMQLDEGERIARAAARLLEEHGTYATDGTRSYHDIDGICDEESQHIARWRPSRAMREVQAKRAVLSLWEDLVDEIAGEPDFLKRERLALTRNGLDSAIHAMGIAYADRPGFRDEWRP